MRMCDNEACQFSEIPAARLQDVPWIDLPERLRRLTPLPKDLPTSTRVKVLRFAMRDTSGRRIHLCPVCFKTLQLVGAA